MPEEQEVETHDIQESLGELHEHQEGHEPHKASWTRFISLTTALLAAFAAVGALQSGALVNEALIAQIKASDTWNQYQSARQKTHIYTIESLRIADGGVAPAAKAPPLKGSKPEPGAVRLRQYLSQADGETKKTGELSKEAKKLELESEKSMHRHHEFAYSVALLQVAIALGAVSALTRSKPMWLLSSAIGVGGIVLFILGFTS